MAISYLLSSKFFCGTKSYGKLSLLTNNHCIGNHWLPLIKCLQSSYNYKVYNRENVHVAGRINGVKIWVGEGLTGGNYDGAENIGTINFERGTDLYVFSDLEVKGSSVQIQGGEKVLSLAEVEVYGALGE